MQFRRIFQRGVGFVFFVVIDQTKRVVQVGDLANVQFIDIATRSGGDIATPLK
jgi:phosphoribosylaminoimidazole (AIR) synthetase